MGIFNPNALEYEVPYLEPIENDQILDNDVSPILSFDIPLQISDGDINTDDNFTAQNEFHPIHISHDKQYHTPEYDGSSESSDAEDEEIAFIEIKLVPEAAIVPDVDIVVEQEPVEIADPSCTVHFPDGDIHFDKHDKDSSASSSSSSSSSSSDSDDENALPVDDEPPKKEKKTKEKKEKKPRDKKEKKLKKPSEKKVKTPK